MILTVFTKPWRELPLAELGALVRHLGFDGLELPVRPGYQIPPERVAELPAAARALAAEGVRIYSIAGPADEATIAACGAAGVPLIRIMAEVRPDESYVQAEERHRRAYDALLPALRRAGVALGVQNHCDRFIPNALGLARLLQGYDPAQVAAVWDAGHEAVCGGLPEHALDVVWPHLRLVNLKSAYWKRTNGPEAPFAAWRHHWTDARHGLCAWPVVIDELKRRGWAGPVCLTAEYSDAALVDTLIAQDAATARALWAK